MTTSPHAERIRSYLSGIERGIYSREARLTFWRLIISSAHDAHEQEVLELESLSVPMSDPILTSALGEIVV